MPPKVDLPSNGAPQRPRHLKLSSQGRSLDNFAFSMVTRWLAGFPHLRPLGVLRFSGRLCNLKESRSTGVVECGTDGSRENSEGQAHATLQRQAEDITMAATRLAAALQQADMPDGGKPQKAKRGTAGTFAGRRPPKSPTKLKAPPQ